MQGEINNAVSEGILTPISNLRLNEEKDTDEFKQGLVFDGDMPEVFCSLVNDSRVKQLQLRTDFSDYLVLPSKFSFPKVVRILAHVLTFIKKCRRKPILSLEENNNHKFSTFHSVGAGSDLLSCSNTPSSPVKAYFIPSDQSKHLALTYLFQKATQEVLKFNSATKVEKVGVMESGILYSKNRILDSMNYVETAGIEFHDLSSFGIKAKVPIVDRYSPLAYSLANHVHWKLAKHRGVETCNRMCLSHVNIIQGMGLFKEISEGCIRCRIKRKKYLEVPMGPISDHQLRICPPFWAAQADLFGPYSVYVPGYERNTRGRNALSAKCWVMCFVCPVSRLTNLQVIEKSDSSSVIDGITRLACEVGVPKFLMIDQDSAVMRAVQNVEFEYLDMKFKLHTDWGIHFTVCPVNAHNQNGQVERKIRSVQDSLNEAGLPSKKLHATGLQTLLKLVENQLNNLPLGFTYGRDIDNTPLLKIISPNMLRVGRNNERALDGPMRLPVGGGELLQQVEKIYTSWFKIWNDAYIPKLLYTPKWFNKNQDLNEGDIVIFQKKESELDSAWSLGTIDQLIEGRDGMYRRAIVKYRNANENLDRVTDRGIRSLVKIWSLDDQNVDEDLAELQTRLKNSDQAEEVLNQLISVGPDAIPQALCNMPKLKLDSCCCVNHCRIEHTSDVKPIRIQSSSRFLRQTSIMTEGIYTLSYPIEPQSEQLDDNDYCSCTLNAMMTNLNLNLE